MIEEIVVKKLRNLPETQQEEVLHFVEYLEYKAVRPSDSKKDRMVQAAQALLSDYEHDDELTIFTTLDGEELYA